MTDVSEHAHATTRPEPKVTVVTLPQEIDITTRGLVRNAITEALRGGAAVVVADATGTTFCDCAGVSALIRAHDEAAADGARIRVAASSAVRRILRLTGADHVLSVYPEVAAALDGESPVVIIAPPGPALCGLSGRPGASAPRATVVPLRLASGEQALAGANLSSK